MAGPGRMVLPGLDAPRKLEHSFCWKGRFAATGPDPAADGAEVVADAFPAIPRIRSAGWLGDGGLMPLVSGGRLGSPEAAMSVSLPNLKPLKSRGPGPRFIQVPETAATGGAAALIDKHSEAIEQLRVRLGFEKDTTVIAWLLEQIEQSPDLSRTIADLLGCP